jgi:hypothetical protein
MHSCDQTLKLAIKRNTNNRKNKKKKKEKIEKRKK